MSKPKKKFYVVWKGRQTGVFHTWEECNKQINSYAGAIYKSFPTLSAAETAFQQPPEGYIGHSSLGSTLSETELLLMGKPIPESISVDGAWNTSTGIIEYQGVETGTGKRIFHVGPLEDGTNNIAEFLAIVHALAHCKQHSITLPIYSDSRNAIGWVRDKKAKTNLLPSDRNLKLFGLLERAENWLNVNDYPNKILKWETEAWGENPADFGRK